MNSMDFEGGQYDRVAGLKDASDYNFSFFLVIIYIFPVSFGSFCSISKPSNSTTGYLPNSIHAVEAMLAAASIGAIWSSTSPDFGINVSSPIVHFRKAVVVFDKREEDKLVADGFCSL